MHKFPAVVALVVVAGLVTGCQSPPDEEAIQHGCVPTAPGEASDAIRVSGDPQDAPSVAFDGSLNPGRTERTVVDDGDGRLADAGSLVTFAYAAFSGSTGDVIDTVGYTSPHAQATVDDASLLPGLQKALLCSTGGSRLTAVVPAAEAFGEAGNARYGIAAGESVVFVIDVVAVAADRARGERQAVMDSLPQVHVGATGEPIVTIPPKSPPAAFSATVLTKGDGDTVTEGATVTVEYLGVVWASDRTFDSTWRSDKLVQLPTSSFVTGFGDALLGQTVGSQVLAIVPPSHGYGQEGNALFGITGTDTLVFVIDILAVVQPPAVAATQE